MKRFLIAGAAGYVGSRLAARLMQQGHSVRGLVRDPDADIVQDLAAQGMSVWQGDVTQPDSLVGVANGIEYVYNLTTRSLLENGSVRRVLVEGNRNLIAACSRSRTVLTYVFTGNSAPYGDRGDEWLSEDSRVAPCHPYGDVMVETEQVILDLVRRHNFPAIILRVGSIYGPGRDVVDAVLSGTTTLIGNGRNFIPHIHIEDLIEALSRIATEGQPGSMYNVADDEPMRAADFYGAIRERLGMLPPRIFAKEAALFAGIDPSIVGMASSSARMTNRRIKEELGLTLRYPTFLTWLDERMGNSESAETPEELAVAG
jgi:nucleoside-diphosphate-sugar epimerase